MPSARRALSLVVAGAALTSACGAPPELREPADGAAPLPAVTQSPVTASVAPTQSASTDPLMSLSPTATGFPEETAVACGGRPSGSQVVALLRRSGDLRSGGNASVQQGPLCAGAWQYTVVTVQGADPLFAVTRGEPGSLTVVTAGTDVCSIPVRTAAPAGIRTLACGEPATY